MSFVRQKFLVLASMSTPKLVLNIGLWSSGQHYHLGFILERVLITMVFQVSESSRGICGDGSSRNLFPSPASAFQVVFSADSTRAAIL